jgi:hypothetical protein
MTHFLDSAAIVALPVTETEADPIADRDQTIIIIAGKRYFTRHGLARELKKSERTIARWDALLIGPPRIVIGRMVLYDMDKIAGWLACHEREAPHGAGRRRGRLPEIQPSDDSASSRTAYAEGWPGGDRASTHIRNTAVLKTGSTPQSRQPSATPTALRSTAPRLPLPPRGR